MTSSETGCAAVAGQRSMTAPFTVSSTVPGAEAGRAPKVIVNRSGRFAGNVRRAARRRTVDSSPDQRKLAAVRGTFRRVPTRACMVKRAIHERQRDGLRVLQCRRNEQQRQYRAPRNCEDRPPVCGGTSGKGHCFGRGRRDGWRESYVVRPRDAPIPHEQRGEGGEAKQCNHDHAPPRPSPARMPAQRPPRPPPPGAQTPRTARTARSVRRRRASTSAPSSQAERANTEYGTAIRASLAASRLCRCDGLLPDPLRVRCWVLRVRACVRARPRLARV